MSIRLRFAPSPTGRIHVGNVRTALMNWLFAIPQGGEVLLRIDDTDLARSTKEYEQSIEDDLKWLGLHWQERANQSHRFDAYEAAATKLKAAGLLYPAYETEEELDRKRKIAQATGKPPVYDRAALKLSADECAKLEAEGRKPHWRFKLNHAPIVWNDLVRGEVKFDGSLITDPVLIREDGTPLYHLGSVIDDIDYKITHVVRGEDHLSNTAFHIQMFEAIDGKVPEFAHLSLISDAEGGKLSKRLGSMSIGDLRDQTGLEPQSIISLMGRMGTSDPIEAFANPMDLAATFDFDKFSRGTPKFDPEDLIRLNAKIIHQMEYAQVKDRLKALVGADVDENFWMSVRPNLEILADFKDWWTVAKGPVHSVIAAEDKDFIVKAATLLPDGEFSRDTWNAWLTAIKANTDRKGKTLFMPLRKALTGMEHGPELDGLLPLIGRARALERLAA